MSRVADQLGQGSSFTRARGGVSARRQAVAATTGAPTAGAPDSRLRTLPITQLAPNRFNPRRNFGTSEQLREFGLKLKKKQLQPAVVVTREAYLALWPEEEDNCQDAPYVIANGERRYRATIAANQATLEVVVDDEVAKSRADFLDAVLSENIDREDLDPIERAIGVQTMVEQLGGHTKVAEHYDKTKGWVTQQIQLLSLVPELQDRVSAGELPVREARALVKVPEAEQVSAWRSRQAQRAEEKANSASLRKTRTSPEPAPTASRAKKEPAPFTAVNTSAPSGDGGDDKLRAFTAVNGQGSSTGRGDAPPAPSLPDQRPTPVSSAPGTQAQVPMSWDNGVACMDIFFKQLSAAERRKAIGRYLELLGSAEALVEDLEASSTPAYREELAALLQREG